MFMHEEATKTGKFNRYALEHVLKILPHVNWNNIYAGEEKDRLPRRTRIMKAYNHIKNFYQDQNAFLISDADAYKAIP